MRPRGLFVTKLIQFFEGMHLFECNLNEQSIPNIANYEGSEHTDQSDTETNNLRKEAPTKMNSTNATSPKAEDSTTSTSSLPVLHSSMFLVPSLQMLFELVGYRCHHQSLLDMAELCYRLLKVVHVLKHPLNVNRSVGRCGYSLDDLTFLDHQHDVLDNMSDRLPRCSCPFSTNSVAKEKWRTCAQHNPTRPKTRNHTHARRCSADESATREFTAEKEMHKLFGPPTPAEFLKKENKTIAAALKQQKPNTQTIDLNSADVNNGISTTACEQPVEPSLKATAAALKDFNASVELVIEEIQSSLLLSSPLMTNEDVKKKIPTPKTRHSSLKRKLLAKLPPKQNETEEQISERKHFLKQRESKKEVRRGRRLFSDSINPSIFSQFCSDKGAARCTEQIEWKSNRNKNSGVKNRPSSPNIDVWATLAKRDSMLETSLYKYESKTKPELPLLPPKTKAADEIDLNKLFLKRLANIDPIVPCCCCSCHYRFSGFGKTDVSTETETRTVNAETQTTSFATYDETGKRTRRKESRTKSEGGAEKQPEIHKAEVGNDEKQPVRHNVTKRFLDFINDQTSCVTGNKQQRAKDKQETLEFRQFFSRFLEDSTKLNEEELPKS